ncbi:MAG: hypothetical protein NZ822_00875 [Patescibacteria group bacterium]|nr:hypothetical protein [Patescibacteria group bacterium]
MIQRNFLIVDIIPLIRLPTKAPDYFTYFSNMPIKEGALVKVKFKKREVIGYIANVSEVKQRKALLKKESFMLKPILEIVNHSPPLTNEQLRLAKWFKNYNNTSLATALSMFFPYKNLIKFHFCYQRIKNSSNFKISYYSSLEQLSFENKKVLIIVPQESYLKFVTEKTKPDFIISSTISSAKLEDFISEVSSKKKNIFIGVKNSIFLPWQNLDSLIIYEEGSYFYKEFFRAPFFDYRKLFLKFCQIHQIEYIAIDKLPSFYLIKDRNLKIKQPISFEKIDEMQFFQKLTEESKSIIFTPEKNISQKIICENCFRALQCKICQQDLIYSNKSLSCRYCFKHYSLPELCPVCQQRASFVIKKISGEVLFQLLRDKFPNVFFLEKESSSLIKNFLKFDKAILIGSLHLFNPALHADSFFFFHFDRFYTDLNLFRQELFLRMILFFKERVRNIYLVGKIVNPDIEKKIKDGSILEFMLEERKINELPPYQRLVILRKGSINLNALQKEMIEMRKSLEIKNSKLRIVGPIFSHPFKIRRRFFLELVLRLKNDLSVNLRKILENIEVEKIDVEGIDF